jgi:hypothetical protein
MIVPPSSSGSARRARPIRGLSNTKRWFHSARGSVSRLVSRLAGSPCPLWTGSRYTDRDRDGAIERGLQFLGRYAAVPQNFFEWGHDFLWCFYTIASTSKNARLCQMARVLGQERAREWRRQHAALPVNSADDLAAFLFGTDIADRLLGDADPSLKEHIRAAIQRFSVMDFLAFDPRREPPPTDVPDACEKCEEENPRGTLSCGKCGSSLNFLNPYAVWMNALVTTYSGDAYGVPLGASYPDVLRWISAMRPYPAPEPSDQDGFIDVAYAITHVIYTLNDYGKYRLSAEWLPQEFNYLAVNMGEAVRQNDWETVGEFMDTLRAFGWNEASPEIRTGVDYLLAHQNPDGSWGDMDESDIYCRYHPTWTAIDGLREYSYQGERLLLPHLLPLLRSEPAGGQITSQNAANREARTLP